MQSEAGHESVPAKEFNPADVEETFQSPQPTEAEAAASPTASKVTVRLTFRPDGFYVESPFDPSATVGEVIGRIEEMLRAPNSDTLLLVDGRPLAPGDALGALFPAAAAAVSSGANDTSALITLDAEMGNMPDHLTVLVPADNALASLAVSVRYGHGMAPRDFCVTVVKGFDRKPFLGGFRNKRTEAVYHHATTQCQAERAARIDTSHKISRMTQTQGVTRSVQTRRECSTQMSRSDLEVDSTYDRIVVAKPYFSADRLLALQIQKTVQLQAFVRGWRARRIARRLRQERDEEDLALQLEDMRRREEHSRRREAEIERRTHPRSVADFNVLHNELEAWRLQETARIKEANLSDEERRLAMMELLKKQTKLLQTIDRLQIQAGKDNRVRRVNNVLNKMSSAKNWGTKGASNVETPLTIRARELRDLYNGLQLTSISTDERLDVLMHVKWTVKEFECILSREITELIDRESDLLNRGRKDSTLVGLRQRLSNLFLQFIETPEFNPEAAHFTRVPLEHSHRPLVKLTKK